MVVRLFIAFLAIVMAALAGGQALSAVVEDRDPFVGMDIIPANGRVFARAAELRVQQAIVNNDSSMPKTLPSEAVDWATRGFRLDPSAPEAVRTLALAADVEGNTAKARALMRMTSRLSRRDSVTDMWLSRDYLSLGRPDLAYGFYNVTLLTTPVAARFLLPKMVANLNQPGMIDLMSRLLKSRPFWADDFWREVIQTPAVIASGAALRLRTGDIGSPDGAAVDQALLGELVARGRLDDAARYYRAVSGRKPASDNLESDFSRSADFPPFDWDLTAKGELAASIDSRAGRLYISATPGAFGVAARRLVLANGGTYRLSIDFDNQNDPGATIQARLRCASGAPDSVSGWSTPARTIGHPVLSLAAPKSACPYKWLELQVSASPDGDQSDIAIKHLVLQRQ